MISYELPGARVLIRPARDAPEVHAFAEIVEQVTSRTLASARQVAQQRVDALQAAVGDLLG